MKSLSRVRLSVTPWTTAYQVPPSMGFSRQEYWSELPFPSPGDLPNPGIKTRASRIVGRCFTVWATREVDLIKEQFSFKDLEEKYHCHFVSIAFLEKVTAILSGFVKVMLMCITLNFSFFSLSL